LANPEFRLDPPEAGKVEGGNLILDPAFLGPVRVFARHSRPNGKALQAELFEDRDSTLRGIHVGQTLRAGHGARRLFHNRAVELDCPAGAFPQGAELRLLPRPLSRTFSSLTATALEGPAWEISNPSSATLAAPLEIRLSPPLSRNPERSLLRRFDAALLRWFDLADTGRGDANAFGRPYVSAEIENFDGQYYGLFSASKPLGLSVFDVLPNPFSPRVTATRDGNTLPGARIRFRPESDSSAAVTISLRVYTMSGEPVCTLIDHKTYAKTDAEIYWDGRDSRGRRVRNGRYLLSATLTPTGGGRMKSLIRPVVVYE
jgi:hypothetical protein